MSTRAGARSTGPVENSGVAGQGAVGVDRKQIALKKRSAGERDVTSIALTGRQASGHLASVVVHAYTDDVVRSSLVRSRHALAIAASQLQLAVDFRVNEAIIAGNTGSEPGDGVDDIIGVAPAASAEVELIAILHVGQGGATTHDPVVAAQLIEVATVGGNSKEEQQEAEENVEDIHCEHQKFEVYGGVYGRRVGVWLRGFVEVEGG